MEFKGRSIDPKELMSAIEVGYSFKKRLHFTSVHVLKLCCRKCFHRVCVFMFICSSQFQNVHFCPISASPLSGIYALLRQAQISILEILNVWMPVPLYLRGVVKIFGFLDLEQN
jgi:hypothetical protein